MENGTSSDLTAAFRASGRRMTNQRKKIVEVLESQGELHPSASQIHRELDAGEGRISVATVYNTLRAFCDAGLVQEVTVDGSKSYFDTRVDDHPHFYWEDEARLTDAPADQLEILRLPDAPEGTEIAKVDVVIRLRKR